jgi:hypothetical protein
MIHIPTRQLECLPRNEHSSSMVIVKIRTNSRVLIYNPINIQRALQYMSSTVAVHLAVCVLDNSTNKKEKMILGNFNLSTFILGKYNKHVLEINDKSVVTK